MAVHKGRKVWKGYAPAEVWRGGEFGDWCPCVWEVTESLNEHMEGLRLRSTVWEIGRVPGVTGKPEVSGVLVASADEEELRPAFDVFPLVSRLYGFLPMQWGVKSHIPKRLRLDPVKGTPPPGVTQTQTAKPELTARNSEEERAKVKAMLDAGRRAQGLFSAPPNVKSHAHNGNGQAVPQ